MAKESLLKVLRTVSAVDFPKNSNPGYEYRCKLVDVYRCFLEWLCAEEHLFLTQLMNLELEIFPLNNEIFSPVHSIVHQNRNCSYCDESYEIINDL